MRSRAKSNRKWKSNGKRGTSRNQFLRAHVFSCVFVFLPFETSGSASCRTIGFANCSILCCGNKCRVRPLVCMAFGHNEREWEDFRIFQPLIFSNFCLHLASFSLEHVGTDLAISTVFLLNLRQQLTLSLALQARYLVAPAVVLLWDTMKYWSRMAGTLCSISFMVWTIVPHASHRWAFGMYRKSTDFVQSFRTCLRDLRLYNKWSRLDKHVPWKC